MNENTAKKTSLLQNLATYVAATLIFSLLYIFVKVLWLALFPIAIYFIIRTPKEQAHQLMSQRNGMLALALMSSFIIGMGWVTFGQQMFNID